MTAFNWDENKLELEIINPQHPTYVPLGGNKCWALLPSNLDWYCYLVDTPNYLRILKRIGVYLKVGKKQGSLPQVLDNLKTFYGANYLRLRGHAAKVGFEFKVYPDLKKSLIYLVTYIENLSDSPVDVSIVITADLEFHKAPWGCYGFSEEASSVHTWPEPFDVPKDDRIRTLEDGSLFVVSDVINSGIAFIASNKPQCWSLARSEFSFNAPDFAVDTNETEAADSFCAIRYALSIPPSQKKSVPVIIGYQEKEEPGTIWQMLKSTEKAFQQIKNFYQTPLVNGIRIETPDPLINAQFNLHNFFIKMGEHRRGKKHAFLPGAHYHNWICPRDFFQVLQSYIYMNDRNILTDGIKLYRNLQHPSGRIPEGVAFSADDHESGNDRNIEPDIKNTNEYIYAVCQYIKFRGDKDYAVDIFPSLKKAAEAIRACKVQGLITPGCNYGFDRADYPGGFGESPQTYTSAEAYRSLIDLSELANWLNCRDYAEEILTEAKRLKETINEKLWMEARGYYRIGLPTGKVGKDKKDRGLFYEEMLGIGNINVVEWGVPGKDKAKRVLQNIKGRLFTPYGMKFLDPPWIPSYTDNRGITYEAGRVQQGGLWPLAINDFARAEIKVGLVEEAFRHFLENRIDKSYSRFKMWEKGKELSFICPMEWVDTDLVIPVTSILFLCTSASWTETLLEHILGIKVGYDEIQIKPSFPSSWNYAKLSNLRIGESTWKIEIKGNGEVKEMFVDGVKAKKVRIIPGKHQVTMNLA